MGLKIVFMGTPLFAERILNQIIHSKHSVIGVVTVADKPAGRGQKIRESEVKLSAQNAGIPILQPISLKDPDFIQSLNELNADVFMVVAFRMLPKEVWQIPKLGTINLHASLLPQYRGAAPINWAIMNGEKVTGVTTFLIDEEIDTGSILFQKEIPIEANWNAGDLHDKMFQIGADLVIETLEKLENHEIRPLDQKITNELGLKSAPKLTKENTKLNFSLPVKKVTQTIKGLNPYPSSWCLLNNNVKNQLFQFKIHSAEATAIPVKNQTQLLRDQSGILFPCSDFYVSVKELQMEGKRKMNYKDFLLGHDIKEWGLPEKSIH